jgi:hypothetical protein
MRVCRGGAVAAVLGLVIGLGVLAAPPASADSVWYQAFERSSQDAPCVPPADESPWQDSFTGQREWAPSWAQWANDGHGGWVCQRYVVWAQDTPPAGCVLAQDNWLAIPGFDPRYFYLLFGSPPVLPAGTYAYADGFCSVPSLFYARYDSVIATNEADAQALCDATLAGSVATNASAFGGDPRLWTCQPV